MDKKRVARKPALNEGALAKLGTEKLAKLIVDEAGRNSTFRKLVTATLAAAKSPEAVAGVIDKRLASLERTKGFVDWSKAKEFAADLANTVGIIASEIGGVDAEGRLGPSRSIPDDRQAGVESYRRFEWPRSIHIRRCGERHGGTRRQGRRGSQDFPS